MTSERFETLKEIAIKRGKLVLSDLGKHNVNVLKDRIKNNFDLVVSAFNQNANDFKTNNEADSYIVDLLRCEALTDEEWNKVIPFINVYDFNEKYDRICRENEQLINAVKTMRLDAAIMLITKSNIFEELEKEYGYKAKATIQARILCQHSAIFSWN